jgi:xylulokinase
MAPKFEWFKAEFPEESKKIEKYLMISGYIIGKLGDLKVDDAVMDRSYASWTGLADVAQDRWSDEICGAIGLDQKYLPKIVNSNTLCGKLSPEAAKLTGLTAGIALVSGAGDKIAGCLGSATVDFGDVVFEASSYGQISCCVPQYRPDFENGRYDCLPSAIPGEFYLAHFAAGSGITLDWFANTFARKGEESVGEIFQELEGKAKDLAIGSNGLMAIGLLGGSSMPSDGAIKGMWMGHDWSHGKEHFYRALLESYSYDFALCFRSYDNLYPEYNNLPVRVIGGGAKSPMWVQMTSDATKRPYFTINRTDSAMWGATILAGNAIGLFGDLKETAKSHIKKVKSYTPDQDRHERYHKHVDLYRDYLVELRSFYQRIQDLQG